MAATTTPASIYERLGVRTFINARGTITTLGGSIMPPEVVAAMAEASLRFVRLEELHERVGERIAGLTGSEAAYVCAGAASGMLLAGAACLTGTDRRAIAALPDTGGRPNRFVISLVDSHYYVHQGFLVCGGELVQVGSRESVTAADYEAALDERTAAVVFFLGSQPLDQLRQIVPIARKRGVPVIVDAAAQLPPRSHLTGLTTEVGADLAVFSGGKGLFGPQSSGLILGRADLVEAASLNSSPRSGVGRGMKVGKEEVAGLLRAVELFLEADEEQVISEWERRCRVVAAAAEGVDGVTAEYDPPYTNRFPPASPLVRLRFAGHAPAGSRAVETALEQGEPSILVSASEDSLSVAPQTLQEGEAEIIADRLRDVLSA